jgi:hypothetical protein
VVGVPCDVYVCERPTNRRVALASQPGVPAVPADAVGVESVGEGRDDSLRAAVCDDQVALAVAVRRRERGESVEQTSNADVASVFEDSRVEDEDGRDGATVGRFREADVVGDAEVASVPE